MKLKFCHIVILGIVLGSLSGCGIPGSQKTSGSSKNQVENTATKKKAAAPEPALPNDIISETEQEIVAGHDQTNDVTVEKSRRSQRDELRAKENKSIPGLAKPGLPKQKAEMPALANSFRTAPFPTPSEQTILLPSEPVDRENYAHLDDNPLKRVAENPVSTFSIDVDTGSYANVRRLLKAGRLPVKDAVRVEEMINYFDYAYSAPKSKSKPFNIITEVGPAPWSKDTYLLHIGIKGYDVPRENMPAANLVFLVDVSGSMRSKDKLGLLKNALKLLVNKLRPQDHVALVVYAGASGVVLEPTSGKERVKIITALDSLTAGGSTNGGAGIRLAYAQAEQGFIPGGINRVLLATDGDFNVGTVNFEALKNLVEEKRKTGISLTTLGFGTGNYNDQLMEQLADVGNGNYAYIDTLNEAQKVLVDQMASTFQTIAKDVKIQVHFNPAVVAEYRLIGYENRLLKREDFNNDKVDAGEIGAGHTVSALYEVALQGGKGQRVDPFRYGQQEKPDTVHADELAFLRLRYKLPQSDTSTLYEEPVLTQRIKKTLSETSARFRFAASVAAYGQLLRGGIYTGQFGYDDILALARPAREDDSFGYRSEFISLVNLTKSLAPVNKPVPTTSRD